MYIRTCISGQVYPDSLTSRGLNLASRDLVLIISFFRLEYALSKDGDVSLWMDQRHFERFPELKEV